MSTRGPAGGAVSVLTLDQQRSRTTGDAVPALLATLAHLPHPPLRPFQRTAGDEVQGVLDDAALGVDVVGRVLRLGGWTIGIGVGPVTRPLPEETRAGQGEAFLAARKAVNRAKTEPHRLAVTTRLDDGSGSRTGDHLETVLALWAGLLERRTAPGWEVHDALAADSTYADAGARLGISQSAVSQRARTAGILDERRARSLASDLWGTLVP